MSTYIQLGKSGHFIAPCSGWAVFQCVDGVRTDNSGAISGDLNGESYTCGSATDTPGPYLEQGNLYTYSFPDPGNTNEWCIGAGNWFFDADGVPNPANATPYDAPAYPSVYQTGVFAGLYAFSLALRIDVPTVIDMEQRVFSTGTLYWRPLLSPNAALVQPSGGGALIPTPSLVQPSGVATTLASAATRAAGAWAIIDLGSAIDVALLKLYMCSDSPAGTAGVSAWVTNSESAVPADGTCTALPAAAPTPGGSAQAVTMDATAAPVNGRYVLVATANVGAGVSVSFAGLQVWGDDIQLAELQSCKIDKTWHPMDLETSAMESLLAIDRAYAPGAKVTLAAQNVGIRASAVAHLAKTQLSGTNPLVNTAGPVMVQLFEGIATFSTVDTTGRTIVETLTHAQSGGLQLPCKLNDYMIQSLTLESVVNLWGDGTVCVVAMHQ